MKTLLELITADWLAAGNTGPLTRAFIDAWRAANPAYGDWPLWVRFSSGSRVAVIGLTHLDRAFAAWAAAGHPAWSNVVTDHAFAAFEAEYIDEFDEAFYDRPAAEGEKAKRAKR